MEASNKNKKRCDIAVIGAGPAGISSAIRLKVLYPDSKIVVIERSAPYNKIGSVIRRDTLDLLEELAVDRKFVGNLLYFGEENNLIGINRFQFENGLRMRALQMGIEIIADHITCVRLEGNAVICLQGRYQDEIYAKTFVDGSGQAAIIPKSLGKRELSGPQLRAAYAYFHSENPLYVVKNLRCRNGFVWVTPVPFRKNADTYQLLFLVRENVDPISHRNYLDTFPELRDYGLGEHIALEDPCGVLGEHIRQYPSFIYETTQASGDNWAVVGDANSIIFDKVFSGMDQALRDGLSIEKRLAL